MINKTFVLMLLLILSSCVSIYFTDPQPEGGVLLTEFPEELYGVWTSENETININENGVIYSQTKTDEETQEIDTIIANMMISDTFQLYKISNFYVVNYKENDRNWEFMIIQKQANGDINLYESRAPESYTSDKHLKLVNAHYYIEDTDTIVEKLNPEFEENGSLSDVTFSGKMQLKTMENIIKHENIVSTLVKNGTIISPAYEDEE